MADGRVSEVISVVARRRRWTLEQKLGLVEEVLRPGASVASVADGSPREARRPSALSRGPAGRPGKSAATVEVVLSNGRVLRASETIAPEVLGRLASALDG